MYTNAFLGFVCILYLQISFTSILSYLFVINNNLGRFIKRIQCEIAFTAIDKTIHQYSLLLQKKRKF
jgi:hypothetical protein